MSSAQTRYRAKGVQREESVGCTLGSTKLHSNAVQRILECKEALRSTRGLKTVGDKVLDLTHVMRCCSDCLETMTLSSVWTASYADGPDISQSRGSQQSAMQRRLRFAAHDPLADTELERRG
jgi:hypothetical protein